LKCGFHIDYSPGGAKTDALFAISSEIMEEKGGQWKLPSSLNVRLND
jgi:hypothetical protein